MDAISNEQTQAINNNFKNVFGDSFDDDERIDNSNIGTILSKELKEDLDLSEDEVNFLEDNLLGLTANDAIDFLTNFVEIQDKLDDESLKTLHDVTQTLPSESKAEFMDNLSHVGQALKTDELNKLITLTQNTEPKEAIEIIENFSDILASGGDIHSILQAASADSGGEQDDGDNEQNEILEILEQELDEEDLNNLLKQLEGVPDENLQDPEALQELFENYLEQMNTENEVKQNMSQSGLDSTSAAAQGVGDMAASANGMYESAVSTSEQTASGGGGGS